MPVFDKSLWIVKVFTHVRLMRIAFDIIVMADAMRYTSIVVLDIRLPAPFHNALLTYIYCGGCKYDIWMVV